MTNTEIRASDPRTLMAHPEVDREACWQQLPEVIRAAFDCTRNVSVADSLRAFGVENPGADGKLARVYESLRGPLVVTVWHDEIEHEADGGLTYWIDTYAWPRAGEEFRHVGAVDPTQDLLRRHVGEDVYMLLLKRDWRGGDRDDDAPDNAPDIVMWNLEAAGQQWLALRRPAVRRSDAVRMTR